MWSGGPTATLQLVIPKKDLGKDLMLTLSLFGFGAESRAGQKILVTVNGLEVGDCLVSFEPELRPYAFIVPYKITDCRRNISIQIHVENPISPKTLGRSGDGRELGIALGKIELTSLKDAEDYRNIGEKCDAAECTENDQRVGLFQYFRSRLK